MLSKFGFRERKENGNYGRLRKSQADWWLELYVAFFISKSHEGEGYWKRRKLYCLLESHEQTYSRFLSNLLLDLNFSKYNGFGFGGRSKFRQTYFKFVELLCFFVRFLSIFFFLKFCLKQSWGHGRNHVDPVTRGIRNPLTPRTTFSNFTFVLFFDE